MISAIIQARMGSKRFPGKIFCDISGKPLIWHVIDRARKSKYTNDIVVATSKSSLDDVVEEWCAKENINIFRGSENNVLERYYEAATKHKSNIIIRVTADNPLKDPMLADEMIQLLLDENLDFIYNTKPPTYPEGLDTEIFTYLALEKTYKMATDDFDKEHVTQLMYRHPQIFSQKNIYNNKGDFSFIRWTIDTKEDYILICKIYNSLYKNGEIINCNDAINFVISNKDILNINANVARSHMHRQTNIK